MRDRTASHDGSGHGRGEPVGVRGFLQVLQLAAPEAPPGAAHHGWAAPGEKFKFGVPKRDF